MIPKSIKAPFSSLEVFRQAFNAGLHSIAAQSGFGTFILACANATGDAALLNDIKPLLEKQYQQLSNQCRTAFLHGRSPDVVDEDLLVFLKLHTIGFDEIHLSETRAEAVWNIQYNQLRAFRPKRISQSVPEGVISAPFNGNAFHFNKPFMANECFWQGSLQGRQVDLFYNKYPFADLHGLLVLARMSNQPQWLKQDDHHYIFDLCEALAPTFQGIGFGYNSYGAYASVNHLHFQMFVDAQGLPVSRPCWKHNGGDQAYPATCHAFNSASAAWALIDALHASLQPYNLLYGAGRVYVFPRKTQGTVEVPAWSSGFTWYEMAGGFVVFNADSYANLSSSELENYLRELRVA